MDNASLLLMNFVVLPFVADFVLMSMLERWWGIKRYDGHCRVGLLDLIIAPSPSNIRNITVIG
jgi:hypothetical protein